jgi:GH25 family lysozyme M1 (1,4-beta-N-acetylmuramidase)
MARIYGWDQSHYDGNLTTAILAKAKSEGIAFVTHKLGEGLSDVDDTAATALAAARSAGFQVIGGYWFIHGNDDPVAEAKRCIAVADEHESWWRTFPGWFWQTDAETSSTGLPSPAYVKKFSDELATLSGKRVIVYASHGMYGNTLSGLGHPLWNANYGSDPHGSFTSVYPGDSSSGWGAYSGQTPVILQYGSNATIAGITTCDANAFKGSIDQLLTLIGGHDMPITSADSNIVWSTDVDPSASGSYTAKGVLWLLKLRSDNQQSTLAGMVKTEAAIEAAVSALVAGGSSVDTSAVAAQIKAVGDTESNQVADLQSQVNALQEQVATLQAQLAAADASNPTGATALSN